MTHPDILRAEAFGCYEPSGHEAAGSCTYCGNTLYSDEEAVKSCDGIFCDMDCCCEYYEIRRYFG